MSARRPMRPEDLRRVVVVEELDLSGDGRLAVVVRRSIEKNRYVSHLFAIDVSSARDIPTARQLTRGTTRDASPRLCPDGHTLAFRRRDPSDDDAVPSIALMDLRTGAVRMARTGAHGAVGELAWSPDGRRLAFTAEVDPPRFIVGPTRSIAKRGKADSETPTARRVTRADWRWDEEGHLDRWSHLFVLDRPGSRPRQVTSGDWGVADIAWHPDGRHVAFTSDRGEAADTRPRTTIWSVDVDSAVDGGAEPTEILGPGGWAVRPSISPDGRWVAAQGVLEADPTDDISPSVIVGPIDGGAPPRYLAPELDRPVGNWVDCDLNGWFVHGRTGPVWIDDRRLVAVITDRGRSHPHVFEIDASGKPGMHRRLTDGDTTTHWIAASATGRVAMLQTDGTRAMELTTLDVDADARDQTTATPRVRSRIGSRWQDTFELPEMRLIQAPGVTGPIDVWIATPADAKASGPIPTVVDIHGGPLGCWAPSPHLEVLFLTSAGFRVVLPNIRGSASYGKDWIRPQLGDWGGVDAADVHAAVDHVVAEGLADANRLGVMGLSYGGFMVNWLVGTTDRFAAAVSENGVTNQINSWANSDSGPEFSRAALLGDPFSKDGIDKLWRQSPLRNVAEVHTPLLMLQAEDDHRCPAADNEQFFIALRHLGRPVEYVLYPEESHVYAASGRPDRRVDRMTRVIDWFDRHLR